MKIKVHGIKSSSSRKKNKLPSSDESNSNVEEDPSSNDPNSNEDKDNNDSTNEEFKEMLAMFTRSFNKFKVRRNRNQGRSST